MPCAKIESPSDLTVSVNDKFDETDVENCLENIDYGDLYVLGKLWIDILKTGLLGTKWNLPKILPVVEAAAPPPPPQKPPKMRYKDLPLYDSPHYKYKDYQMDKEKCPKANAKLAQESLLPHVKSYRKWITQNIDDFNSEVRSMKKDAKACYNTKKNDFKAYMRHPDNILLRQAVLALGGLTGCYIGSKKGTSGRLFYTAIGLLASGALCFPKETDETFRTITFTTAKMLIAIYNKYCGKGFGLRERLPCKTDIPPPSPRRKVNVCPTKKY